MPEPTAPVSSGSQIDPKQQAQSSSSHQPASHQSHSSSSTTSSSQQPQQQPAKHSPSPSPRPHYANIAHSAPIPVQPGGHSPRAPHSPSMAYHHPSSTSSSPVRLPRPQNTAELHQELEREQEGAVNRLLHMIRSASSGSLPPASPPQHPVQPGMLGRTPSFGGGSISGSVTGDDGRRHSRQNSDASDLWMMGGGLGGRDEAAFYRTEAEMLARENEMLKRRIRELEDMTAKASGGSGAASEKKGGDKKKESSS